MVSDRDGRPLARLLQAGQIAEPDAIVDTLMGALAPLGASDLVLYLIDYEHVALMPHPDILPHGEHPEVATVDGSMAGRAFQSASVLAAERDERLAGVGAGAGTVQQTRGARDDAAVLDERGRVLLQPSLALPPRTW